jgi:hypothetical protein
MSSSSSSSAARRLLSPFAASELATGGFDLLVSLFARDEIVMFVFGCVVDLGKLGGFGDTSTTLFLLCDEWRSRGKVDASTPKNQTKRLMSAAQRK